MKKIYLFLSALLMCGATLLQAAVPESGKSYYIGYKNTDLYLGRADASESTRVSLQSKNDDYIVYLTAVPNSEDVYTIQLLSNNYYLYQEGYFVRFAASPTISADVTTNVKLTPVAESNDLYTIQWVDKTGTNYLGANSEASGQNTGADKAATGFVQWRFEEFVEPATLEVVKQTPAVSAPKVSISTPISVLFNKAITAAGDATLAGITLKTTTGSESVEGVSASISGRTLTIAHAALAQSTEYTVTIPNGTLTGQTEEITWSFTTGVPVVLTEGRNYNIKNVESGLYLSYVADTWNVSRIKAASNDDDQVWQLQSADGEDVFNIVYDDKYLSKHPNNGWDNVLTSDPTAATTKFAIVEGTGGYTIQLLANRGNVAAYYAPQATTAGSTVFLNSGATYSLWEFEELPEADVLGVKKLTPLDKAPQVDADAAVSVTFTKTVTAGVALSSITIKDANEAVLEGVVGTVSGNKLSIAHDTFAYGKTYTVTVPANAIEGFEESISWSFTIVNPVFPQEPRSYNIKNSTSNQYLTSVGTGLTVAAKNNAATQIFTFSNPDPSNLNVFDIAVNGAYVAKLGGNAWTLTLLAEPSVASQFEVTQAGVGIKLRALSNTATQFLGANNNDGTGDVYLDKTVAVVWELEEVDLPLALYKRFPSVSETNVAINAAVKAQFNKDITASALETVTIKYGENSVVAGVSATATGATISIAHGDFAFSTTYTVTIPAAVVGLAEEETAFSWSFTTVAAPAITNLTPTDNATDVAIAADTAIKVDFDKTVLPGDVTGVKISANSTDLEGVTAKASEQSLTITHPVLDYSTVYTVTVPSTAVKGLVRDTVWSFTTTSAPTVKSTTPLDKAVNVQLTTQIRVTFDKAPVAVANFEGVTLRDAADEDLTGKVSVSGSNLTIAKATGKSLKNSTVYTVTVPANTIKGVTEEIKWSFTTVAGAGIEDVNAENVVVYPTVSKGNLTVTTPGNASVKVVDVSGRTLANYHSNGNLNIDLNYANGLYIIQVDDNGSVSSHKVILKK